MANKKITDLTASGALTGADIVETESGGSSYKATMTQVQTFVLTAYVGDTTITTTGTVINGIWNARLQKRIQTYVSNASIVPTSDTIDEVRVTALSTNTTVQNPTGTPTEGQELIIRIKGDATPRTIGFGANFRFSGSLANPGTTTASKTIYFRFIYNFSDTKWDCIDILDNF